MNILRKGFIYGGDYNPEQWLDRPDILEKRYCTYEKSPDQYGNSRSIFLVHAGTRRRPLSVSVADRYGQPAV